ncbi:MAG: nitric oxide synthase oxygenase [Microcoleus sp. PH2017_01_SCD_O_A]|uniref:nitric oxide synthase oxygenase n=1 Tax=Microcoleus sp. PH2017_01_SCD_O_A TaxID=2798812 RepID=UPI001DE75413|nr:nitric oxide synthase oxygenase [Microcoleus sp. PH2017_01_SCD_O_A]MCC3422471.1 nitric oxide synthase oxygenase [Microcoleus sp. PH2017_01_SCD_O_A]MCC3428952.1 nitric oxide synthase oxygenase [Microcoleus sp. PH2017_04_SCI_O_A]
MHNNPRIIHLTEVSATDFPTSDNYRYKCRVQMLSDEGQPLLQKDSFSRKQPSWLLDLKNNGDCTIAITLCYREGDITLPWQDAATVTLATQDYLNGETSAELEFPIANWNLAPQLKLKTRLTQSTSDVSSSTLTLLGHSGNRRLHAPASQSNGQNEFEMPEAVPLTPQEEVIVKDVWNKLRAWKELQMEKFLKRLLLEAPELEYIFGDALDTVSDYFFELLDCCVHQLQPYTQNVISEPLMGVPAEKGDSFDNVQDYGALFADMGMRPHHWLKARQVWMWMLPSIPYLEEYDRENLAKGTHSAVYRFFNTDVIVPMVEAMRRYEEAMLPDVKQRMADSLTILRQNTQQIGEAFFQTLFEKYPFMLPIFGRTNMDYLSLNLFEVLEFLVNCFHGGSRDELIQDLRVYIFNEIDTDGTGTISIEELIDYSRKSGLSIPISELNDLFARVDVDGSGEIDFDEFEELIVQQLGTQVSIDDIPSCAYAGMVQVLVLILEKYVPDFTPELGHAWQTLFDRVINVMKLPKLNEERFLKKAKQYLKQIATEQEWEPEDQARRWVEIQEEVKATGTYTHTYEELAYGAQLSWRNASKCIARIQWNNMVVRDRRYVTNPDEMFRELEEHLRYATNGGNIQITMTVFRPKQPKERWGPRIWNSQLIRYAAYEQPNGSIMGDGANFELTAAILKLGWQPPEPRTPYDILPLVIEVPGMEPKFYEFHQDDVLEVEIEHPTIPEFKSLGFRWYAIPAISNFRMDIGGITYACLPFNGWYMGTEIMRDFLEDWRYDKTEDIAKVLKLDTSSEQTLWRDRVALELNIAILYSFQKAKVSMVDHQTASKQFIAHDLREKKAGRECPADWGWVVPPSGGSTCPVWHHQMRDFYLDPAYHYGADRWTVEDGIDLEKFITTTDEDDNKQDRILILYASETGTAEGFARKASRQLQRYKAKVMALDEYNTDTLASEKLLLIVTSTFGNGEIPGNGQKFLQWLKKQPAGSLSGLSYSILGIGSTVYEHFCAAAISVDKTLAKAGANCIVPLHKGDEIKGQADTFKQWLGLISRVLGEDVTSADATTASAPKLNVTFLNEAEAATVAPLAVSGDKAIEVPVVANQELLQEVIPGSRSTRYIMFDISDSNLQYETGDHVAIYPCNPPELVQRLCDRLSVTPNTYFTASYVTPDGTQIEDQPPIAVPTTVGQVFSEELDLALREPFNELLTYLYSVAQNPQEKHRLETWLEILRQVDDNADSVLLKKTIADNFMSVLDLFDEFPSAEITLATLLELLPKQKPRLYSISSSPLLHPQHIQITVGVLQIKTDAGKVRQGLCSNYLAGLEPGAKVRIGVRTSSFRPPSELDAPMLMVGPGTGVSPLIAFLQYRDALLQQGQPLGDATLYFGCRNHSDFLYQEQMQTWQNQGVLSGLEVAFSRLGDQKLYVQNLMQQNSQDVWKLLSHPKCHYYVCGDAKMADDVFEVMLSIAKTEGGLSHIEAAVFFDNMKQEKRFTSDVWGVQLNFKQAIKQVQKDNYSKAEGWLIRVQQSSDSEAPVKELAQPLTV